MDGVSAAASVVALIETSLEVVSLCAEYYSNVKNAKKDACRLCLEVKAFVSVLQNLDKLARSPGATRLFASRSLNDLIQKLLIHLEHLQKKLEPGKGRKAMSRCGIRALKWPFERKELEKDPGVLERYKSIFTAALTSGLCILGQHCQTGSQAKLIAVLNAIERHSKAMAAVGRWVYAG